MTQLTPAGPARRAKPRSTWGRRERWILVAAFMTAMALGLSGILYLTRPRVGDPSRLSPAEVWMEWQDLRQGIDRRLNPMEEEFLERLQLNQLFGRITLAAAIIGAICIAIIYAAPRRPTAAPSTKLKPRGATVP